MKNVILIGFMGSGKSTVGKLLTQELGFKFLDTDKLIEKKERRKISDIFAQAGEKYFRKLETDCIKKLAWRQNLVLATGGGIILKKINARLLRKMGPVVYLKVSPKKVLERLGEDQARPLLNVSQRLKKIRQILKTRKENYLQAADLVVNTDNLLPSQIVKKIVKYLEKL
jgi:shikimate kinase